MYLEQTSLPFADKLLQAVRQRNQMAAQGQIPGAFPQELMEQVNQGTNPKAMAMLNKAFGPAA